MFRFSAFAAHVRAAQCGGGVPGLPAHARRALIARGWLTEVEFAEVFTLAQLTPGPNAVNLAAMVGVRLSGKLGALLAVTGIMLPGLVMTPRPKGRGFSGQQAP